MDNGGHSPADHADGIERSLTNRNAVTNGRRLPMGVGRRTVWARRFRDLVALRIHNLGGPDNVSEAERSIVRRASELKVGCERLEASFATAEWDRPSGRPTRNGKTPASGGTARGFLNNYHLSFST